MTLCADEVLYLPVTTEITSLPQLTPEGLPLALARRTAEQARMTRAAAELAERGEAVTSRALAEAAHISLNTACTWLREGRKDAREDASVLSTLQYHPHSSADNTPSAEKSSCTEVPACASGSADPHEAPPMPQDGEPLWPALAAICPAASHRLLWRWEANTWHCPLCGTSSQPAPEVWRLDQGEMQL